MALFSDNPMALLSEDEVRTPAQLADPLQPQDEVMTEAGDEALAAESETRLLAPLYRRIEQNGNTIARLTQENANLKAAVLAEKKDRKKLKMTVSTHEAELEWAQQEEKTIKQLRKQVADLEAEVSRREALNLQNTGIDSGDHSVVEGTVTNGGEETAADGTVSAQLREEIKAPTGPPASAVDGAVHGSGDKTVVNGAANVQRPREPMRLPLPRASATSGAVNNSGDKTAVDRAVTVQRPRQPIRLPTPRAPAVHYMVSNDNGHVTIHGTVATQLPRPPERSTVPRASATTNSHMPKRKTSLQLSHDSDQPSHKTNEPSMTNAILNARAPKRKTSLQLTKYTDQPSTANTALSTRSHTSKRRTIIQRNLDDPEIRQVEAIVFDNQKLANLASHILEQLRKPISNDDIESNGLGALRMRLVVPRTALDFAHQHFHATPPEEVAPCFARLYEDASLLVVAEILRDSSMMAQPVLIESAKRVTSTSDADSGNWLVEIIGKLDMAIIKSKATMRRSLVDHIFNELDTMVQSTLVDRSSQPMFLEKRPRPLGTLYPIINPIIAVKNGITMTSNEFQNYIGSTGNDIRPLVLFGVMDDWAAVNLWDDLTYFLTNTSAGLRHVPVEIGKSYTEPGWRTEVMKFRDFVEKFLVPEEPDEIGYLAQYDFFEQIPTFMEDIKIPDYCYASPPAPPENSAAAKTAGLTDTRALDTPLIRFWFGPKGTKSDLHTDPYHNILCQVKGYKYVRLYRPEETKNLYPRGKNGAGVDMSNTSQIDFYNVRLNRAIPESEFLARRAAVWKKFPLAMKAKYEEAVIGPGESLYIPLGWWHYIESLTTSISVSFWFN